MRRVKVIIYFQKESVPQLIEFARNTVVKMTGNALFPTPAVSFGQLTPAINDLETKYNAAQGGGRQQTAAMLQAHKALENLLRKQAVYVDTIADGNEAAILSSGFHTSKQPIPVHRPEFTVEAGKKALDAFIESTHEGAITVKRKAVKGARVYVWQYAPDPLPANDSGWTQAAITTQASYIISGLKPGTKYWFRASYVTPEGQSGWCDPVVEIVV